MTAEVKFYDTLTRKVRPFKPVTAGQVKIYLCGPTVYRQSHIGHAVGPVIFDALKRYLTYLGYKVTLVINVTDVDDKLIDEASRVGCSISDLAERMTADYLKGLAILNVQMPDLMPRATEHIGDIIDLVKRLEERGYAYQIGGDMYFQVAKDEDYGKLSGRKADEQQAASRELQSAQGKRGAGDFALWKATKPNEPSWDSPWGMGRPGWHIECSAMSMKLLGETFDIHGGGLDLVFPHHENEIAQSESATGKPFVNYWLHNGLTRINTKKMSKSSGQIRTIAELTGQYPGETIRFFIISTHYRRPIDFSDEAIQTVAKGIQTFYRLFEHVGRLTGEDVYQRAGSLAQMPQMQSTGELGKQISVQKDAFFEALADDFNTAAAIACLYELAGLLHKFIGQKDLDRQASAEALQTLQGGCDVLMHLAGVLGLFQAPVPGVKLGDKLTGKLVELLIDMRKQARVEKNYQLADQIRDRLGQLGVVLEDTAGGTTWRTEGP